MIGTIKFVKDKKNIILIKKENGINYIIYQGQEYSVFEVTEHFYICIA